MIGPTQRMIRQRGREYTVRNASDAGGDRTTPSYADDGTLVGVLERRTTASPVESDASGEEVETELELRAVVGDTTTIREKGETDYPTLLVHPDGLTYRVRIRHPEDSGVTVLSLERA